MSKKEKLAQILGASITREEALLVLQQETAVYHRFLDFPSEHQEKVLEFIQGIRGLPILYDSFFRAVFNPSIAPERLERFLSCLMEQQIHIIDVIPREGSQMTDKGSFVIMDVLVQTEDGSYINVEMQKHGYEFTGERSTCYMSDLVMRQYTQVKSEKKSKFSFKDLKPVYLIALMEHSTKNFKQVSPNHIHRVQYTCDTGANINFLANYMYVSLDTFHSVRQNISSYLDAWFTFLSSDAPEDIISLIDAYPEFKEYYHDIALFRKNPKELMNMYSEALIQMDKNTANYMIEEMQKELEALNARVDSWQEELAQKRDQVIAVQHELAQKEDQFIAVQHELAQKEDQFIAVQHELAQKEAYIKELEEKLGIHTP